MFAFHEFRVWVNARSVGNAESPMQGFNNRDEAVGFANALVEGRAARKNIYGTKTRFAVVYDEERNLIHAAGHGHRWES